MSGRYILQRGAIAPESGQEHDWGRLTFFTDEESTGVAGVTVGMARIQPTTENPLHVHPNCSEVILLLAGAVEHVVGEELVDLVAGDVLIVPAGTPHQARSVGQEPAEMVVVYNSGRRGFEVIAAPD